MLVGNTPAQQALLLPSAGFRNIILPAAGDCPCEFDNVCSCHATMSVLNCVAKSCTSGDCECHKNTFHDACMSLANTCGALDFECHMDKAVCVDEEETSDWTKVKSNSTASKHSEKKVDNGKESFMNATSGEQANLSKDEPKNARATDVGDEAENATQDQPDEPEEGPKKPQKQEPQEENYDELYEELMDLKEEKCRLQLAVEDGWLNADKKLDKVMAKIGKKMQELAAAGQKLPEMHCYKHFEEWHDALTTDPPPLPFSTAPPAPQSGTSAARGWLATAVLAATAAVSYA